MTPTLSESETPAATERRLGPGLWHTRDVTFESGSGAHLFDLEGRRYIDCASSHGVAILGHGHPALIAALASQSRRLISCTPAFGSPVRARYLEELTAVLPEELDRVFLCNSGTEAVEAALKFARIVTGKSGVLACMRGFHGRTMGALSASHDRRYREAFAPLVPGFRHVPYDKLDALDRSMDGDVGAVILEIVQGEGGVRPGHSDYLRGAQELCRERGVLLVIDEVQTGFGRTGSLFAFQQHDMTPDMVCLAKGMAGGLPMGATLLGRRVGELPPGCHGSTFGGNPLACAAARSVLGTLLEEDLPKRAEQLGRWLRGELRALESSRVRSVRGAGLMIGIELRERSAPYLAALLERGVVALSAGPNVIRLLPPLTIEKEDLQEVIGHIADVLA